MATAGITVAERSERILTTPQNLLPLLAELPNWTRWSPWEDLDPNLGREYTGEPGSVGSTYGWSGNRKAGAGRMRVTGVSAAEVGIDLDFTRPYKSSNAIRFILDPEDDATRVTWRMETPKTFFSRFVNLEKLVCLDFEKDLANLKRVAEAAGGPRDD